MDVLALSAGKALLLDALSAERRTYLLRHEHDESVLLHRVLRQRLALVVHDLSVRDQLLSLGGVAVRLLNLLLQSRDL